MRAGQRAAHGAALLLVLSGAAAACPTAADLETGITFADSDGDFLKLQTAGEDVVTASFFLAEDVTARRVVGRKFGAYIVSFGGGRIGVEYTWERGEDALPYPQLGLSETFPLTITFGRMARAGRFTIRVDDTSGAVKLGGCQLETWALFAGWENEDGIAQGTHFHWFPSLGAGVPVARMNGNRVTRRKDYVGIEW
ncbi:MAG: hypothetical protein AAGH70_02685 [Pseudomonadota bacterium]